MSNTQKENIVLADCEANEIHSFVQALQTESESYEIKSHISNFKRTGKLSELKRYFIYFFVGFKYFLQRKKYNKIVGWQQFYALILCFFCSIFKVKKTNMVTALNFTYKEKKGKVFKIYKWFMSKCLDKRYLDYIHVPSKEYADSISCSFDFPREKIIVTTFGVNDEFETLSKLQPPQGLESDGYALAIGRSNRDYEFLIDAWKKVDYPLVIISDTFKGEVCDENITLLTDVAGEQSYPYIANCSLMVIPIDDPAICSGDTVLLTSMFLKKKIIVTKPSTLSEMYIKDKQNALLSEKNPEVFAGVVKQALSEEYQDLGERARESFIENFSRESMGKKISVVINQ